MVGTEALTEGRNRVMIIADEHQWSKENGLPDEAPVHGYVQVSNLDTDKDPLGIVRGAGKVLLSASKKTERTTQLHAYKLLKSYQFIEFSEAIVSSGLLVVDIDEPDSELRIAYAVSDGLVPPPSYYIVNDGNGHAQAAWHYANFTRDPFHGDPDEARIARIMGQLPKQEFLLKRLKASLSTVLHGDRCFTHTRFRNPYCTGKQRVMLPSDAVVPNTGVNGSTTYVNELYVYSLKAMADFMDDAGSFNDGRSELHGRNLVNRVICNAGFDVCEGAASELDGNVVVREGMRNTTVFAVAVHAARQGMDVQGAAESVNCSPRLPKGEMRRIVESARRCASKPAKAMASTAATAGPSGALKRFTVLPDDVRQTLSDLGRKGGSANTRRQSESRMRNLDRGRIQSKRTRVANRDKVIRDLRKGGATALKFLKAGGVMHIASQKRLAKRCGMSLATVRRCLADIVRMLKRGWSEMRASGVMPYGTYRKTYDEIFAVNELFGRKAAIAALLVRTAPTPLAGMLLGRGECMALAYADGRDAIDMMTTLA